MVAVVVLNPGGPGRGCRAARRAAGAARRRGLAGTLPLMRSPSQRAGPSVFKRLVTANPTHTQGGDHSLLYCNERVIHLLTAVTDRQTDRQTEVHCCDRQTDRQTDRQKFTAVTDRQTDRQTDR